MVGRLENLFPGLRGTTYRITSPATRVYNCIAWAAIDTSQWWWPEIDSDNDTAFWPETIPREETIEAFIAAFATLGFLPCGDEAVEVGFEKVAVFADDLIPTHAARQLSSGLWTSKLGRSEDIEHELHALTGDVYGAVVLILKRPLVNKQAG